MGTSPFWPGVVTMLLFATFGGFCLWATYLEPYQVATAVPLVGIIWTTLGIGGALYFAISR